MNVSVRIDENQDFKKMIVKRIQQELHEILKTDFKEILQEKVKSEMEQNFFLDKIGTKIDVWTKEYVIARTKSVLGDSYYSTKNIDTYINEYIDKKLSERFNQLFEKRFQPKDDTK